MEYHDIRWKYRNSEDTGKNNCWTRENLRIKLLLYENEVELCSKIWRDFVEF